MRRLLLALLLAAAVAGAARAETFTVVATPEGLPSHEEANAPGAVAVPFGLSTPPAVPEQRGYEQLLDLWQRAGEAYGVPWQVLASINKIESDLGRNMGPSSAGAIGWMQFLPSSWMRWGMDASGDGVADPWNPEDAVYSAARYLAAAGAQWDLPGAILAYNHAQWYVDDVLKLARLFGGEPALGLPFGFPPAGPDAVFLIDDLEQRLEDARQGVTRAKRAAVGAERALERLEWATLEAEQRAGDPELGDEAFRELEAEITRLALARERARLTLERRRAALAEAVALLDALREEASAVTFSRSYSGALAGAPFSGDYVFPVGGGREAVSVAPEHHDYPAADIAAPEGSPVYVHSDSVVLESYPSPSGPCGIGLKLRTAGGATYTYCHLAYLEPNVFPGTALAAGASVGLVGSTGRSSGPHLHLQLVPAVAPPQDEPWFRDFAGRAFSWTTPPTEPPRALAGSAPQRVFAVVEEPVVTFTR